MKKILIEAEKKYAEALKNRFEAEEAQRKAEIARNEFIDEMRKAKNNDKYIAQAKREAEEAKKAYDRLYDEIEKKIEEREKKIEEREKEEKKVRKAEGVALFDSKHSYVLAEEKLEKLERNFFDKNEEWKKKIEAIRKARNWYEKAMTDEKNYLENWRRTHRDHI